MKVVVVPSEIAVPEGWTGKFTVQVLARDSEGNVFYQVPATGPAGTIVWDLKVRWELPSPLPSVKQVEPAGHLTQFEVSSFGESEVVLSAYVDGVLEPGTLTLRRTEVAGDEVQSAHTGTGLVDVLLAAGSRGGEGCVDEVYGFVGRIKVPSLGREGTCRNEAVLLSSSRAAVRRSPLWTEQSDVFNASGNTAGESNEQIALPPRITLKVIAQCRSGPGCENSELDQVTKNKVAAQVDFAKEVFRNNRVGVELSYDTPARKIFGETLGCADSRPWVIPKVPLAPPHDVVVLLLPTMDASFSLTAQRCELDDARRGLVLMNVEYAWDAAVLVHELGHVLGLLNPDGGHVGQFHLDQFAGFGHDNIMAEADNFIPRFRFTLGQVHRMNFEQRGLLSLAGREQNVACGCPPLAMSPCPPLVRDFKPLELAASWTGSCTPP